MEDAWMDGSLWINQSINQMRHVPTRVDIESARDDDERNATSGGAATTADAGETGESTRW